MVIRSSWMGRAMPLVGAGTGAYLMAAPAWCGYVGTTAEVSHRVAGPVLVLFWLVALWEVTRNVRWWTLPIASWLLVEPVVLTAPIGAKLSATGVGVLCVVVAWATAPGHVARNYNGGWLSLWRRTRMEPD